MHLVKEFEYQTVDQFWVLPLHLLLIYQLALSDKNKTEDFVRWEQSEDVLWTREKAFDSSSHCHCLRVQVPLDLSVREE